MNRGSRQSKDTAAQPSQTQQCQKSSRVAPPHRTMLSTQNPTFAPPRRGRPSAPQLHLSDRTRLRRFSHTLLTKGAWRGSVSLACLSQVAIPPRHVCGQCVLTPHLVGRSWTLNTNTEKPAAPPKPPGDTRHTFTAVLGQLLIREFPQSPENSQKHHPDRLISSLPLLSWDAARLWTCGILQRSRGPKGRSTSSL